MEKLVKLLNEYRKEKGERNLNEFEVSKTLDSLNYLRLFIKRLVENDYINMNKVEIDAINYFTDESPVYGDKIWTTRLIMMLSVSNFPIKDLIYYLGKEDEHYIKPGGYKLVFNTKKS